MDQNTQTPGQRLRKARRDSGFETTAEASRAKGFHRQNLADHEADRRRMNVEQATAYGKAFKVSPAWLLFGIHQDGFGNPEAELASAPSEVRVVPIVGEVRAGSWTEVVEDQELGHIPVNLPEYRQASLFALRVSGNSMNLFYPDGSIVVVCPAVEAGVRDGDHVVVRRNRGMLVETTIKEIVSEWPAIKLWPRSSDEAFQSPIDLLPAPESEDEGVQVIGVVVASVKQIAPRTGPLLWR